MRLLIVTLSFILSSSSIIAQDNSAHTLKRIFKSNLNGTTFKWNKKLWSDDDNRMHLTKYNSWRMCNDDSLYYKSKIIRLYNYSYYDTPNCEWYKELKIKGKTELVLANTHGSLGQTRPAVKYRIKRKGNKTIFIIYDNQEIDKYTLDDIELEYMDSNKSDSFYVMTLNRIKKTLPSSKRRLE